MTLLTILASTARADEHDCLSSAGFIDRQTAAAEEVVLWSDGDNRDRVEAAAAVDRGQARVA